MWDSCRAFSSDSISCKWNNWYLCCCVCCLRFQLHSKKRKKKKKCLWNYVTVHHKSGLRSKGWIYKVRLPPMTLTTCPSHIPEPPAKCVFWKSVYFTRNIKIQIKPQRARQLQVSWHVTLSPGNTLKPSPLTAIPVFLLLLFSIFILVGLCTRETHFS